MREELVRESLSRGASLDLTLSATEFWGRGTSLSSPSLVKSLFSRLLWSPCVLIKFPLWASDSIGWDSVFPSWSSAADFVLATPSGWSVGGCTYRLRLDPRWSQSLFTIAVTIRESDLMFSFNACYIMRLLEVTSPWYERVAVISQKDIQLILGFILAPTIF